MSETVAPTPISSPDAATADAEEMSRVSEQLVMFAPEAPAKTKKKKRDGASFSDPAFASNKSLPIHRWIPWVAGYSSKFVRDVLRQHLSEPGVVLDPFAGVGTTLVEAARRGHHVIGFEINPYAALACRVKLNARTLDPDMLSTTLAALREFYSERVHDASYSPHSTPPEGFRTRIGFYSPRVLRKVLTVQDFIATLNAGMLRDTVRLAFAATMIQYSNYSYEPSLGTRQGAGKQNIDDYGVFDAVEAKLTEIIEDVRALHESASQPESESLIVNDSFFSYSEHMEGASVDLLITSPPYLNNYHYVRNTRPQLYWLDFVTAPKDTKPLEHANFGKYWQTVRGSVPVSLQFDLPKSDIAERLDLLRTLNPEKGVYGGGGWANYAATYFNDCYRFAEAMQIVLKPGGEAFIVVGNSILQGVNMPVDEYLGQIAECIGLELVDISVPRKTRVGNSIIQSDVRVGKAKKNQSLYEAVVHLRRPG